MFELEDLRGTIPVMNPPARWKEVRAHLSMDRHPRVRRLLDVWPLTPLGVALAVVACIALFGFGYAKLDLVLLVLGYGGAGLIALSTLSVCLTALVTFLRLRKAENAWEVVRFETGRASSTGFRLPALRWLPLVRLRCTWDPPLRAEVEQESRSGTMREQVTLERRGVFAAVVRRVVVEDAFGLARVAFRLGQEGPIEVLPHLGGLRRLPVLTSLTGGDEIPHPMGLDDGDRVETRRYIAGDPARFIHWKAFSRTRKLMVRVPERSLSRARRTVAYLVSGAHDEAAAAAARAAIEEEALGVDWQFAADGAPEATSDRAEALHKIMLSASATSSGSGMRQFLAEVDRKGPAAFVVFAPPRLGSWVGELAALSRRRVGRVRVVVALDAVAETDAPSGWKRWLLSTTPRVGVGRRDVEQLGRALGELRCEVVMIDRRSGRILGDASRVTTWSQRAA